MSEEIYFLKPGNSLQPEVNKKEQNKTTIKNVLTFKNIRQRMPHEIILSS